MVSTGLCLSFTSFSETVCMTCAQELDDRQSTIRRLSFLTGQLLRVSLFSRLDPVTELVAI
ncbi:hypothetical protein B0H34DRAFT_738825 [Crassisporium funariophilum]|nr:hypothetical protein B0H34DRAFT_738825 [Crassisporium funariophilum]